MGDFIHTIIGPVLAVGSMTALLRAQPRIAEKYRGQWKSAFTALSAFLGIVLLSAINMVGGLRLIGSEFNTIVGLPSWLWRPAIGSATFAAVAVYLMVADDSPRRLRSAWPGMAVFALAIGFLQVGKYLDTMVNVSIAVSASAAIWVGANMLFNQVTGHWERFNALAGAAIGFLLMVLLDGNGVLKPLGPGPDTIGKFLAFMWTPLIGAAIVGAGAGWLSTVDDPKRRLVASVVLLAALGVAVALLIDDRWQPGLDYGSMVGWTLALAVVGGGLALVTRGNPPAGATVGGSLGWILGGFGSAALGSGSTLETLVATVGPAVLIGWRLGITRNADRSARSRIDSGSRGFIFLVPALLVISVTLVVPTLRTIYLSLLDRDSEKYVGLENYGSVFSGSDSFDVSNWTAIFTSRLFLIGAVLLVMALGVAWVNRHASGSAFELGGPALAPMGAALVFLSFAVFTVLRGTIFNNLWWVFTVTGASTALGLAIAVLADRAKLESLAKSIIFMPMAVSLVGASIIWRFMYVARNEKKPQTGLMNWLWVGLGHLSKGSGIPTIVAATLVAVVGLALLTALARALVQRRFKSVPALAMATAGIGWFFVRFVGSGVGGFRYNTSGVLKANPILFVQERPFNNFWLMVILIWIETGFAMVILSAAIKAVPSDLIEAAKVDGASESQIFWRITIPQIATTIGVVVTTLIVLVMKVFDIVKVVTNGQFGTQVLANDMFNTAFNNFNRGRGAALAVILFLSVLPVMVYNIRRMQKEAV